MKILNNKYLIPVWTVLRIWLGYQWISAGLEKVGNPAWVGSKAGTAVSGFLQGALAKSTGDHPAVQWWYARFVESFALPNAKIFSYLVAYGEVLVGISLIFGVLTIVGLIAGAFMNLNYLLAGTTSTNPILYTVAIILMVAGASAYKIGFDSLLVSYWKKKRGKQ
ncbi:DoxX family protein [Clostridium chromiireducens]|uniref:DoxX family protein n=1 Tax=Clostridium chromiireducens TaxID=225345 RepID=UPI003AF451D0